MLSISTQTETLLQNLTLSFEKGKSYLFQGKNGVGKSTLLMALNDLHPYGTGDIKYKPNLNVLFLSHETYRADYISLRAAISYPISEESLSEEALENIIKDLELSELYEKYRNVSGWLIQASDGERQQIQFARALFHRPDVLFLDEALSQVDPERATALYLNLRKTLPQTTIISIAHDQTLAEHYDAVINIDSYSAQPPYCEIGTADDGPSSSLDDEENPQSTDNRTRHNSSLSFLFRQPRDYSKLENEDQRSPDPALGV